MTVLDRLVTLCRETAAHYDAAARTVGDPGLKLQFKHIAAARDTMMRELSRLGADGAAAAAPQGQDDVPEGHGNEPPPEIPRPNRRRLGDTTSAGRVPPEGLRALVHRLRDHDELILAECQRARATGDEAARRVLEDAVSALSADLDRLSILESLTETDRARRFR